MAIANGMGNKGITCEMKTMGERLRSRRKALGLSQQTLARLSGIRQPTIANLESGRNQGSTHVAELAAALNCRASWLATGSGPCEDPEDTPAARLGIVDVPRLAIRASAGAGVDQPDGDHVIGIIQLPADFIRRRMTVSAPKNLRTIMAYGDSMADTFHDGDVIFVDTGLRTIDTDGIYVAQIGGELFIKRFQRRPLENSLLMISDNRAKYDPQTIPVDRLGSVEVLGRAVWVWNGRKL